MKTEIYKFEIRNLKFEKPQNSKPKTQNFGFTLIEVLTAVVIIAILVGILVPALNMVRKIANDAKQRAQIASIEIGLSLYKNEDSFGDYPPSHGYNDTYNYCGAQTLAEAMFGQDLLGVDPNTQYDPDNPVYDDESASYSTDNRKGPYLDRTNITVLTPADLFKSTAPLGSLIDDKYVICDVYGHYTKPITVRNSTKRVKIGAPVLYFKADTSKVGINASAPQDSVYNFSDNYRIVMPGRVSDGEPHSGFIDGSTPDNFYNYITDEMTSTATTDRPLRPDSFLLISAGNDGLYGTSDDICNFEPNIE